jgi:L,D-transpeptidase YbiS
MADLDHNIDPGGNGKAESKVQAPAEERHVRRKSTWRALAWGMACGLPLAFVVLCGAGAMRESLHGALANTSFPVMNLAANQAPTKRDVYRLEKQLRVLKEKLARQQPSTPYLIVDTSQNRIYLKSGEKLLHEAVCSSGSYVLLKASNNQQWMFSTPRGVFRVLGKHNAPVWRRPDWAFVEEGLPIPAPYAKERYEAGVLGEHGIDFGNGYLIHGTLYQRQLGLPVTHGCIRLGDEDLRIVYRNLQVGSEIFIY